MTLSIKKKAEHTSANVPSETKILTKRCSLVLFKMYNAANPIPTPAILVVEVYLSFVILIIESIVNRTTKMIERFHIKLNLEMS